MRLLLVSLVSCIRKSGLEEVKRIILEGWSQEASRVG